MHPFLKEKTGQRFKYFRYAMNEPSFGQGTRDVGWSARSCSGLSANSRLKGTVSKVVFALGLVTCIEPGSIRPLWRREVRDDSESGWTPPDGYSGVAISKNNGEPGSLFWEVGGGPCLTPGALPFHGQGARYVYLRGSRHPEYSIRAVVSIYTIPAFRH